jgi:hypothetical protein
MTLGEAAKGERGAVEPSVDFDGEGGVFGTGGLKAAGTGGAADGAEERREPAMVKLEQSADERCAEVLFSLALGVPADFQGWT